MPAKKTTRKRRSYKRRRPYYSTAGLIRKMARMQSAVGPFGVQGSDLYEKYGPSRAQMRANPGWSRTAEQSKQRIADNYWGDGDYLSSIGVGASEGAGIGAGIGSLFPGIGTAVGGAIGGTVGAVAGGVDEYIGRGDYGKVANQIVTGGRAPISVNATSDRTGDIVLTQTEYIGTLKGSDKFRVESYELNPGLHKLFPFLSQIANNYELYEWSGLMVCYKPTSGEGGSNNVLGKVIMTTNYDPNCGDFRNSLEMQNYDYASVGKPSQTIVHGIETAPASRATRMLYVRNGPSSRDKEFTDIGKLFVAVEGMPGSTDVVGELHITYRIRLSRAKLYASLGNFGLQERCKIEGTMSAWNSTATDKKESFVGDHVFTPEYFYEPTNEHHRLKFKLSDKDIVTGTFSVFVRLYLKHATAVPQPTVFLSTSWSATEVHNETLWLHDLSDPECHSTSQMPAQDNWKHISDVEGQDYPRVLLLRQNYMTVIRFLITIDNPHDRQDHFNVTFYDSTNGTGAIPTGFCAAVDFTQVDAKAVTDDDQY